MDVKKRNLTKSFDLWNKAEKIIPAGTQTLSKGPNLYIKGVSPIYLERGSGSHVFDVDGNEYIDYIMALGPILLGYDYPATVDAAIKQIRQGTTFSMMHPLEVELAELLVEVVPCAEMVRFAKNGSDATSAAIRASRAYTGRDKIAYCGYHGCQDWYAITTERNKGIPEALSRYMIPFQYNDISSLEKIFETHQNEVGTVIMEQPDEEPEDNFLQKVKDVAHKNGAVFILDEIVTGFRFALGGAQEYFGVVPDLACFGKAMANGFPISAVAGKREIMKEFEEVFFSMTFGGETVSLAAAVSTIKELREQPVLEHIWKLGNQFKQRFNRLSEDIGLAIVCSGYAPRLHFSIKDSEGNERFDIHSLFMQETVKRGSIFGVIGPVFHTFSHTEKELETTLEACADALTIIKKAIDEDAINNYFEGEMVELVFRKRN